MTIADVLATIRSKWAIAAATYARAQVTPLYRADEQPTSYEKGQIQNVSAIYRDGYFAALDELEAALNGTSAPEKPPWPFTGGPIE